MIRVRGMIGRHLWSITPKYGILSDAGSTHHIAGFCPGEVRFHVVPWPVSFLPAWC